MCILLSCLFLSVQWARSSAASNIGALLSGIGTIVLAIVGIITLVWGTVTFSRWKKENRFRKVSNVAEIVFDKINTLEQDILNWLEYLFLVFNKNSDANKKKYETLSPEKQNEFLNLLNTDGHEIVNYVKKGNSFRKEIIFEKNRATLFQNKDILDSFDELLKLVKNVTDNFNTYHFAGIDNHKKTEAYSALVFHTNKKRPRDLCDSIRGALIKYVTFDK